MSRKAVERNILYDDEKKCYYAILYFGKNPKTGKVKKESPSFKTKAEAKKALKIHEGEMEKRALPTPSDDTVETYIRNWLDSIATAHLAESTRYGYKGIIENHLIPYYKNVKLQDLSTRDINKYYSFKLKNKKISSNTLRKHHDLLNNICRYAVKENVINVNPLVNATAPKVKKAEPVIYTTQEVKDLLSKAKGNRIEIVIKLGCYLGLRRGEICGLKWDNIDFEKSVLEVKKTNTQVGAEIIYKEPKTDFSKRVVPIPDDLMEILKDEKIKQQENKKEFGTKYTDNNWVVCWRNGEKYRPNYLSDLFSKFISDNELKKITLHSLRHTFVSIAIAQGINILEVSRMVGHSKTSTTVDIYGHLMKKANPDVTDAVADAIKAD